MRVLFLCQQRSSIAQGLYHSGCALLQNREAWVQLPDTLTKVRQNFCILPSDMVPGA